MADINPVQTFLLSLLNTFFPEHEWSTATLMYESSVLVILLLGALIMFWLAHWLLRSQLVSIILKSQQTWDDMLHAQGFFRRLGHLTPALFIYLCAPWLFDSSSWLLGTLITGTQVYLVLFSIFAVYALLNTIELLYEQSQLAKKAPITGFIQVSKLFFAILALLLTISLLLDKSPFLLLSGLTAIAAILLLIFKDTILGFVAGIQIAANRMFNSGDWIEMQKYGVDGEILQIGLNVVKVQNWDKTIATLPTYTLTNEVVKNWQGMTRSGGRRIKRALYIDMHSVRFCDAQMLENLQNVRFIKRYIEEKIVELQRFHNDTGIDQNDLLTARRLTNIGTFRAYMDAYLRQHPRVAQDMTLMVRQLASSEVGIPLEVYCFTNTTAWVEYEGIQSDIFDHFLAILPLFGLRVYQRIGEPKVSQ